MKRSLALILPVVLFGSCGPLIRAQEISNESVTVRAVKTERGYAGFDLLAAGKTVAVVRLSSARVQLLAKDCEVSAPEHALIFAKFTAREGSGLRLESSDSVRVNLNPGSRYPVISFSLKITEFDPQSWKSTVGLEPFHFLALYVPGAEVWHQRGWLNATPLSDPFPLLLDKHAGTPEISAFHYNRNWSYTPPLGAHPLPVIGLWAPAQKRYAGFEFQTTRLRDNSEKEIATGYRWEPSNATEPKTGAGQFVALVYPFGGQGYQQLVFPSPGATLSSRGTLLWSDELPATDDPNHFVWSVLWPKIKDQLPRVPDVADVDWIPGGIRQNDFQGPPPGGLIGGVEKPFQVEGSKLIYGWTWHNESPTAGLVRHPDPARAQFLRDEARQLLGFAKKFQIEGEECIYWEKPLQGQWTETWGGKPVTTLHHANGFAAGRLFLGLYRDLHETNYLSTVDGVFNWAKHIVWTRNEFADVPSSPFAIGGTLSASFCLEYYWTFKDSPDAAHRQRAQDALELARAFTYRYLVMWPSDNNREDNLDSAFLWEPNSGRDWTGAACANEVFWNLDTLAQTAVHTGDPILMWALQGSLSRWHLLYQDVLKENLSPYQASDMAEGYGLFPGNVYGDGLRAGYGFAAPLVMTEPVGHAALRVLAGEKAALAFRKGASSFHLTEYRYHAPANLSFRIQTSRSNFDLALTAPYLDISQKKIRIVRGEKEIESDARVVRPQNALWSVYLKNLQPNDRIILGDLDETAPILPSSAPLAQTSAGQSRESTSPSELPSGFQPLKFSFDSIPKEDWQDLASWAGRPAGEFWAFGIPFQLAVGTGPAMSSHPVEIHLPAGSADSVYLLYNAGEGPAPEIVFQNGERARAEREALAWRAWPPIFSARLLVGEIPVRQDAIVKIDPKNRSVWAATSFNLGRARSAALRSKLAFAKGATDWRQKVQEETSLKRLQLLFGALPEKRIGIIPPKPGGPAFALAQRAGLLKKALQLTPDQLVDPEFFNPRRVPAAVYFGGEDYLHTVHKTGDGAAALEIYLKEGGTLVLLASQPWPLYYSTGPGFHRPEPLTEKIGLPLTMAFESAPAEPVKVRIASRSSMALERLEMPYPSGDPRLRTIEPKRLPSGTQYEPIATVISSSGKNYGDAAGVLKLSSGGRIFYVAGNFARDPEQGFRFVETALKFLAEAADHHFEKGAVP